LTATDFVPGLLPVVSTAPRPRKVARKGSMLHELGASTLPARFLISSSIIQM
jgi:hypothetical protein